MVFWYYTPYSLPILMKKQTYQTCIDIGHMISHHANTPNVHTSVSILYSNI